MEDTWIGRIDENLEKMRRMEERLGVPETAPLALNQIAAHAHAARRCAFCAESEACDAWLEAGAAGDAWFDFCPNANYFNFKRGG